MRAEQYQRQLDDVTAYIYAHLDDDLDLGILAEVARFSPYHWHRIYRAVRGETAAQTVQRLRLERAAALLVETTLTLPQVARRSGFASTETFSRALRRAYGVPPAGFRRGAALPAFLRAAEEEPAALPVEVRTTEPLVLASAAHAGSYLEIGRAFSRVRDRMPDDAGDRMVAVYLDDADATPVAALRSIAGVVVPAEASVPAGLERHRIPGGRHAVLRYVGPYASMHRAYRWLYGRWLPASGETPRDDPVHEVYLTDPAVTPAVRSITEILLPLE